MIKFVYKYYLKFPPFARQALDISIVAFMNGINVDYYHSDVENVLLDCDHFINEKIIK